MLLSAYIKDQEKLDEMLRLLWLAHALHVHSVIPSSHAGLLTLLPALTTDHRPPTTDHRPPTTDH